MVPARRIHGRSPAVLARRTEAQPPSVALSWRNWCLSAVCACHCRLPGASHGGKAWTHHCACSHHEGVHENILFRRYVPEATHLFGKVEINRFLPDTMRNFVSLQTSIQFLACGVMLLAAARINAVVHSQHCKPTTQSTDAVGGWIPVLS